MGYLHLECVVVTVTNTGVEIIIFPRVKTNLLFKFQGKKK